MKICCYAMKFNRLSKYRIRKILAVFAKDLSASVAAEILKLNRNTINRYYSLFRAAIFKESLIHLEKELGIFEADESYFGARRVRGLGGRGAAGKTPVFGLLKRGGNVFVSLVKNCSKEELMPIIRGNILEGSTIHTDGWKAYDGLILNGYEHYRVYHAKHEFARGKSHVNGIESFWSFSKRRLAKFNGISGHKFFMHLKECEFRFNHRHGNLEKALIKLMRKKGFC
jgi:transposase